MQGINRNRYVYRCPAQIEMNLPQLVLNTIEKVT